MRTLPGAAVVVIYRRRAARWLERLDEKLEDGRKLMRLSLRSDPAKRTVPTGKGRGGE